MSTIRLQDTDIKALTLMLNNSAGESQFTTVTGLIIASC